MYAFLRQKAPGFAIFEHLFEVAFVVGASSLQSPNFAFHPTAPHMIQLLLSIKPTSLHHLRSDCCVVIISIVLSLDSLPLLITLDLGLLLTPQLFALVLPLISL
jgi:hypothetical protein